MMVRIRDREEDGHMIVRFDRIAAAIESLAESCLWRVGDIDGSLTLSAGMTVDEAYALAEKTNVSPWTWRQLLNYTARYFQIADCEFVGQRDHRIVKIVCFDATYWEIDGLYESEAQDIASLFSAVDIDQAD